MKPIPVNLLYSISTHRYLAALFRLYIAGLFLYAGLYKINYTAEFAESIASYRMVPFWGVNLLAIVMPWIELLCGILLITGIRSKTAAVIIGGMLIMFTLGVLVNLVRQSPISCGCFSTVGDTISWRTFFRDLAWIIMTVHIFFYDTAFRLDRRFASFLKEMT